MGSLVDGAGPWLRGLRWLGGILLQPSRGLAVLPPLAWAGTIWLASAYSGSVVVKPAPWLKFLGNGMHAFEFGVLALLCVPVLPRRDAFGRVGRLGRWARMGVPQVLSVLVAVGVYAIVDELHQAYVPGRVTSGYDVLTDLVGAACVLGVVHLAGRSDATDGQLRRMLAVCLLACSAAAGLSTFIDLKAP